LYIEWVPSGDKAKSVMLWYSRPFLPSITMATLPASALHSAA